YGVVYLAEQREPTREVAVKVIGHGDPETRDLARFEVERQALALMEHPYIAKVLDSGFTEKGQPFIVMEYVRGSPITKFCEARKLSIDDRLKLFKRCCEALQHAHQKLVLHRDIKPSNILVELGDDGHEAIPKIIDFGIAKGLEGGRFTDKALGRTLESRTGPF